MTRENEIALRNWALELEMLQLPDADELVDFERRRMEYEEMGPRKL